MLQRSRLIWCRFRFNAGSVQNAARV